MEVKNDVGACVIVGHDERLSFVLGSKRKRQPVVGLGCVTLSMKKALFEGLSAASSLF